jgi:hypothetical protein
VLPQSSLFYPEGGGSKLLPNIGTYLSLLLFILTANGFLPGGSGSTIRHNTQHKSQKITQHAQTKHGTQN